KALAIAKKINFDDIIYEIDCSFDCLNCNKIDSCKRFDEEFLRFLKELNISIEANPQLKGPIESLVETMSKNLMDEDYKSFLDTAHQLIELIGELPALLCHIGLFYLFEEKYKEAKKYLQKAIRLDSNRIETYQYLISIHLDFEEFEQAIGLMKKCHKLDPSDENILVDIACCYLELKHDKKAFNYFQKALKINPALPDILLEDSDCELYLRLIEERV
ncbi:MAG: tetratricopeptide repeat protein, partial [Candidatus Heimdallarchaeota archaeon]